LVVAVAADRLRMPQTVVLAAVLEMMFRTQPMEQVLLDKALMAVKEGLAAAGLEVEVEVALDQQALTGSMMAHLLLKVMVAREQYL
jgi:hypothetical protein